MEYHELIEICAIALNRIGDEIADELDVSDKCLLDWQAFLEREQNLVKGVDKEEPQG